jgi:hypothetical protein
VNPLEQLFPGLAGNIYQETSPPNGDYNCIAWAAEDTQRWWWPSENEDMEYWPPGVVREQTQSAFIAAFATLGYVVCDSEDLEVGFEKIALFANTEGPTHAARQLSTGRWSSKLGTMVDIEHALHDLEGMLYGAVVLVMRRNAQSMA